MEHTLPRAARAALLALVFVVSAALGAEDAPKAEAPKLDAETVAAIRARAEAVKAAYAAYTRAFTEPMSPEAFTGTLQGVARDYLETPLGDDALWLLGELARQGGDHKGVIHYWQTLMSARGEVELESPTRDCPIYARSSAQQFKMLLQVEGTGYMASRTSAVQPRRTPGFLLRNTVRIDAVTMAVWDGLGQSYEALDAPELALRAYRAAAEAAPARGRLAARLAGKVKKLEAVVAARAAAGAPARAEQAPGGAAE